MLSERRYISSGSKSKIASEIFNKMCNGFEIPFGQHSEFCIQSAVNIGNYQPIGKICFHISHFLIFLKKFSKYSGSSDESSILSPVTGWLKPRSLACRH